MKRAAAEEDIYHLFRIMLGRKPSPASYVQTNTGAPLGDLTRRMAASEEFAKKVLAPLKATQKIVDRPLRAEEQVWLKTAAQLPERYSRIIATAPTQFRAAVALALRAFEGGSGRSAERLQAISEVLPPLGIKNEDLASDPKLSPVEVESDAWVDGRDAQKVWALFGGRPESSRAPKTDQRLRLDALTDAVALENLLSDQLVPAIYGNGDLVAWAEIERTERHNWIEQHADLSLKLGDPADLKAAWAYLITSDKQRLVSSLLDQLRLRGADFADAADNLSRMATTRANVLQAIRSNRLPQALLEAKRALLFGEPYAPSLVDLVEEAMVRELDWHERLVIRYLVDRLKEVSPKPSSEREIIELTMAEARALQPEERDSYYLIRLSDYRLSDGVRALIDDVLEEHPILPLRVVAAEDDVPADLLAFEPDPVGVLVSSFSDLSDAVSMLDNGRLPATFSLPVFAADEPPVCERSHGNPIILSFGEEPKKSLPAQFVRLKPGEVIGSALERVSGTDATPVLISHPDLPITSEHLAIATSDYARFGEPPVLSLMGVSVSLLDRTVRVSPLTGSTSQIVSMVWLPMTVLSLKAARGLSLSLTEAAECLIGAQTLMASAGCSGRVAFAAGADEKTTSKAEQVCKPLIARWIAGLREQNPPIAPNLPSLSSLRSQALRGPAAQRLTAASALDNCYRVLASVERLSSGKLEEAEADAIASSQSLEVLLAHGLYTELGEALIKLILGQQEQIFADERTLRWALRAAGSCGMESKITHTLARSAPAIIAAYPDLLRQVFETLASALPSDRIATVLLACIASSPASKTARFRHRVAEISRLYLEGPGARQVFAACGSDPHPQSVQAGFAVALSRDGSDFDWPLPPLEALQLAISDRDREAITAVSRAFAENDTPLLDYLDLLRPFAKELAEMDLDETVLPFHRCRDDHEVALLALISGSESRMAALRQEDNGEIGEELKAMIAASLCDSAAFIDHVNALSGDLGPKLAQLAPISQRWIFQAYTEAPSMEVEPSDGRVSVVMSSLDTDEDLIVPAVESILAQSHEDLELLLIDDGSSRSHLEVLLEIAKRDPRIRAYTMPRNLGPYLCRNFALSVATGCFLAIQDADDIAHPDRLALQVAAMHHEPARQLVTSHHLRIDPRGWPQLEHGFRLLGDGTMTSLFRRSVFDQLGPFLPVRSRGDVEMRERIRKWCGAHALHQIDFPLVACHASPQTLSQRTVAAKGNFLRLFRKGIDAIQPHPEHLGPYATSQISIPAALQA